FVEKHNKEAAGGSGGWEMVGPGERNPRTRKNTNNSDKRRASPMATDGHHDNESEATGDEDYDEINGGAEQRQREHPFIVTEP
ncbi:Unknown protein, partial [Striga hermonthica]